MKCYNMTWWARHYEYKCQQVWQHVTIADDDIVWAMMMRCSAEDKNEHKYKDEDEHEDEDWNENDYENKMNMKGWGFL